MNVARIAVVLLTALAMACSRPASGGAGGASSAVASAGTPSGAARSAPRGMMEGAMGAMPNMMGAATADTAAAPAVRASPPPDTAADCPRVSRPLAERGRAVFSGAGNCFACHGANAKGTTLAPNLSDAQWLNIDGSYASIAALVRTGVAKPKQHPAPMPPLGGAALNGAQVCAVAAYVYSLSHG